MEVCFKRLSRVEHKEEKKTEKRKVSRSDSHFFYQCFQTFNHCVIYFFSQSFQLQRKEKKYLPVCILMAKGGGRERREERGRGRGRTAGKIRERSKRKEEEKHEKIDRD